MYARISPQFVPELSGGFVQKPITSSSVFTICIAVFLQVFGGVYSSAVRSVLSIIPQNVALFSTQCLTASIFSCIVVFPGAAFPAAGVSASASTSGFIRFFML